MFHGKQRNTAGTVYYSSEIIGLSVISTTGENENERCTAFSSKEISNGLLSHRDEAVY